MIIDNRKLAENLLKSWVDYIDLDDRLSARIKDKDLIINDLTTPYKIQDNNLVMSEEYFGFIKKYAEDKKSTNKQNGGFIGLSFPEISKKEREKSVFLPLFIIDIFPVLSGEYVESGWNIFDLEFYPSVVNTSEILRVEVEDGKQGDNQNENQSEEGKYASDLNNYFRNELKLQGSMEEINYLLIDKVKESISEYSDKHLRINDNPYFFFYSGEDFNKNIKKDLNQIKKQLSNVSDSNLGLHYISPKKPLINEKSLYYGAYIGFPPTKNQALSMYNVERIVAVQGPPGSGKTSLILHVIAQQITKRAITLIYEDKQVNNLTFVTSSNNQAVTNVVERFNPEELSEVPESIRGLISNIILESGNREIIKSKSIFKIEKLIKEIKRGEYDKEKYTLQIVQFKETKRIIDEAVQQLYEINNMFASANQRIRKLTTFSEDLKLKIKYYEVDLSNYIVQLGGATDEGVLRSLIAHDQDSIQYKNIKFKLDVLINDYQSMGLFARLLDPIFKLKAKKYGKFLSSNESDIRFVQNHPLRFLRLNLSDDITILTKDRDKSIQIDLIFDQALRYKSLEQELAQTLNQIEVEKEKIKQIHFRITELFGSLLTGDADSVKKKVEGFMSNYQYEQASIFNVYHLAFHDLNMKLFGLSLEILWQSVLSEKDTLMKYLGLYYDFFSSDSVKNLEAFKKIRSIGVSSFFTHISRVFPLMTTTLNSANNVIPFHDEGTIDKVIADEAAMTECHKLYPLMHRAESALVVGDPYQIEPVQSFTPDYRRKYKEKYFLPSLKNELTDDEFQFFYDNYSPTIEKATAFHLSSLVNVDEAMNQKTEQIELKEHFRCQAPIAKYFDELCHYNLDILTKKKEPVLGTELIAYHVQGEIMNDVNRQEIEAVSDVISHLISNGFKLDDIGVISPYRAQADMLKKELQKRYPGMQSNSIGTVHTFQGGQRKAIIFSTKITTTKKSSFLNGQVNILNVAVSRAEELFVLVGDLYILEKSGGHLAKLVKHIEEHGAIREINPVSEEVTKNENSQEYSLVTDCEHIDLFDYILSNFKERLIVVTPWIRGVSAEKFEKAIKDKYSKVKIIYGWNESEKVEAQEKMLIDKMKNSNVTVIDSREISVGTHEKIVVMDDQVAVIGSWNWLSHRYHYTCEQVKSSIGVVIRHERSVKTTDKRLIAELVQDIERKFS